MLHPAARARWNVFLWSHSGTFQAQQVKQQVVASFLVFCLLSVDAGNVRADASVTSSLSLHDRIDQATEASAIGPLAVLCDDANFVRRVYLDLTGVIPTPEQSKEFLGDESVDKRETLVNRLLESIEFSRHMAVQFTVLLLDRRTDKYVDQKSWDKYLIDSIEARKPLDQIYRELVYPDEIEKGVAPARKFLLNRGVEPHALTRDMGRMLFGMDLQCAQCHDHPLIDDYYQSDYFGLFAFLNRTTLFEDPKSKVGMLSEKADGEAPFESVFTGEGQSMTRPRLPKGAFVYQEPRLSEEQAYEIKPDKTQAAKPVYSRRETLATMLADDLSFRRNVANRVWALAMGRGLVHPSDFHYMGNPPVNPALLELLADELAKSGFDLRHMLREIMLSKTYQRDCEPPSQETINLTEIRFRLDRIEQQRQERDGRLAELKSAARVAEEGWLAKVAVNDKVDSDRIALGKSLADAKKSLDAAKGELAKATQAHQAISLKVSEIERVLVAAQAAYQKLADEKSLADSIKILDSRKSELSGELAKAQAELQTKTDATQKANQLFEKLNSDAAALDGKRIPAEELTQLERVFLDIQSQLWDVDAEVKMLDALAQQCQRILDHAVLLESDPERASALWDAIVERWTLQGQVASLKPLTPEQLAVSAMRATGVLNRSRSAAEAAVEKTPPAGLESEGVSDEEKQRLKNVALQTELLNQLRGSVNQFVEQFGGLAGEEFQATANQALFLGNSPTVNSWLAPSDGALVKQLASIEAPEAIADELSLAVLSRPATIEEHREVQRHLTVGPDQPPMDRTAAIAELVWAALTSNEFRFNH